MYSVYRVTNVAINKSYIGSCKAKNLKSRQYNHITGNRRGNTFIAEDLPIYTCHNFIFEEIHTDMTKEQAENLESIEIRYQGTLAPYGYNRTRNGKSGGIVGADNPNKRPEFVAKMTGDNNVAKRPEVRAKISANHADFSGSNNPRFRADVWECAEEIVDLYATSEWTHKALAEKFGCSTKVIFSILKAHKEGRL